LLALGEGVAVITHPRRTEKPIRRKLLFNAFTQRNETPPGALSHWLFVFVEAFQ